MGSFPMLKAINALPLVSIVSREEQSLESILYMKAVLDNKGIHKILSARKPNVDLLEQIKFAMLAYGDENSKYKFNMGYDLYKEILD